MALEKSKQRKVCSWFPDLGWEDAVRLVQVLPEVFGQLVEDIEKSEKEWKHVSTGHSFSNDTVTVKFVKTVFINSHIFASDS